MLFSLFLIFEGRLSTTKKNTTILQYEYSSALTTNNPTFHLTDCEFNRGGWYYYESIQINVIQSGNYTFSVIRQSSLIGIDWYEQYFNPYIELSLSKILRTMVTCPGISSKLIIELQPNVTYILVVALHLSPDISKFSVLSFGPNRIILNKIRKCDILVCCE